MSSPLRPFNKILNQSLLPHKIYGGGVRLVPIFYSFSATGSVDTKIFLNKPKTFFNLSFYIPYSPGVAAAPTCYLPFIEDVYRCSADHHSQLS